MPRVHPRCGTNLVLWVAMAAPLTHGLPGPAQLLVFPVLLGAIAELMSLAALQVRAGLEKLLREGKAVRVGTEEREDRQLWAGV